MDSALKKIVVLGSGNVATALSRLLADAGHSLTVWARDVNRIADKIVKNKSVAISENFDELPADADLYVIAVSDRAISEIAYRLKQVNGIVVHTSGTKGIEILSETRGKDTKNGVLYPLQTITKNIDPTSIEIPFLIEGQDGNVMEQIRALAETISNKVFVVDSINRKKIHIAAVIANNFTNYLLGMADDFLKQTTNCDISVLKSLLNETIRKAVSEGPVKAQTGPAVRGDRDVINEHISILNKEDAETYRFLSEKIISKHKTAYE